MLYAIGTTLPTLLKFVDKFLSPMLLTPTQSDNLFQ